MKTGEITNEGNITVTIIGNAILLYKAFPQTCTDTYCFLCV